MNRRYLSAVLALAVAPCATASAQDRQAVQRLVIKSEVLAEELVAIVQTPAGYDRNQQRYPVLYMTDGPNHLQHTAATIAFLANNGRMPEMIVVAIANTDRTRDLTPNKGSAADSKAFPTGGGGDKFLTFIEKEVIPQVEKTYRTQPFRVFAGHSLGGLLVVHAFAKRNELFNAYLAVSPSLWWDNQSTVRDTEAFLQGRKELDRALFITLGNEQGGMLAGFNKAKELLGRQQLKDFVWDAQRMEDEDHGTVVLRSHYAGLKKIFDGWQPSPKVVAGGVKAVEEHYAKLSARYKFKVLPSESTMNQLGYQLLGRGKTDEAISVFKTNVERYPNSSNVYDSLAEAYEKVGRLEQARTNYERAVQLSAKHQDANLNLFRSNFERVSKALKSRGETPEK
jgi:predicted alpha/beta superfamily hydrolase